MAVELVKNLNTFAKNLANASNPNSGHALSGDWRIDQNIAADTQNHHIISERVANKFKEIWEALKEVKPDTHFLQGRDGNDTLHGQSDGIQP